MSEKVCPILSAGAGDALRNCIGEPCMMYVATSSGGACSYVKAPQQLASKVDTLSAQIQEIQVVMNVMSNK